MPHLDAKTMKERFAIDQQKSCVDNSAKATPAGLKSSLFGKKNSENNSAKSTGQKIERKTSISSLVKNDDFLAKPEGHKVLSR